MTASERVRHRKELERLRAEALAEGPARIEPNRKDAATVGVADEDEQALSEMLQTLSSERNKKRAQRVAQIDRALRKLDEDPDNFGICEECEEDIAPKRLAVMPFVTLCTECQAKKDPARGRSRKSITDYD